MLDSLFKQNIAVLAAAILGALFLSAVLIANLVLRPQIDRSAAVTAQMAGNLELSFSEMDPFQRLFFVETLRSDPALNVIVAETAPQAPVARRGWFPSYFLRLLTDRHGIAPEDVLVDGDGLVWIRISGGGPPFWFALRTLPLTDPGMGVLVASAVALLAALAGGATLQRRIARPLKRLETSVARLGGTGEAPELDIGGPREIAAVARALSDMSERLRMAEADRALMLAGVSHDLRTPLTKLRLSLAMLEGADAGLVDGATRQVLRIERMLAQFLDFARGFEAEQTRQIGLKALLEGAAAGCDAPGGIVLRVRGEGVAVRVKQAATLRAIENLLTNAVRYGRAPVVLEGRLEGDALVIEVQDSGPGIPAGEARALVRPFARGSAARDSGGTGLGLAIADQVARAHGGRLEFERHGAGFTARLRLPRAGG